MIFKEYKGGFKNKKFILNYPIYDKKTRNKEVVERFLKISKIIRYNNRLRQEKLKIYI